MFDSATSFGKLSSKIARPQNVVYSGFLSAIVAYIGSNSFVVSIACYVSMLLLYSLAAGYNNLTDINTDRLNNRKDNPLTNESIKKSDLYIYFSINLLSLLLIQFVVRQPGSLLICLTYLVLLFAYSNRRINIKSRGYFSTVLLCICYGSLPFLLGIVQGTQVSANVIYICVFQSLLIFPVVLAKDYKDLKGDRLTDKKTPLVRYGFNSVLKVAVIISLITSTIFLLLDKTSALYLQIATTLTYVLFAIQLHRNRGVLNNSFRLLMTVDMLAMSLQIVH